MEEEQHGLRGMGSISHIAHKSIEEIFVGRVEVTEKVDGSFFSFGLIDGELRMRSKGQQLFDGAPSAGMFKAGMDAVKERESLLTPGYIYRGEYLAKPKHNTLCYDRIPLGYIVIFDIELSMGDHANNIVRQFEAHRLGLEPVPVLWQGIWDEGVAALQKFLGTPSFLGGQAIEGLVVKNYGQFLHGHVMMGKLVDPKFKEVHGKEWKVGNPANKDIVEQLIDQYRTIPRWRKSVQHLREDGRLDNSPRDIGPLLKEVAEDIKKEEEDAIKAALFKWAWPKISRGVSREFPEWYKQELLDNADAPENEETGQSPLPTVHQTEGVEDGPDLD